MKLLALVLFVVAASAQTPPARPPVAAAPGAKTPPLAAAGSGQKPIASVMQIMSTMMIPASEHVFDAGADPPQTDEAWKLAADNALIVAEAANLLMIPGRAKDNGEWMKNARNLRDGAEAAYKAATAKNSDNLTSISNDKIYPVCEGCHKTYLKR